MCSVRCGPGRKSCMYHVEKNEANDRNQNDVNGKCLTFEVRLHIIVHHYDQNSFRSRSFVAHALRGSSQWILNQPDSSGVPRVILRACNA